MLESVLFRQGLPPFLRPSLCVLPPPLTPRCPATSRPFPPNRTLLPLYAPLRHHGSRYMLTCVVLYRCNHVPLYI